MSLKKSNNNKDRIIKYNKKTF